jgi:hypothetical protein
LIRFNKFAGARTAGQTDGSAQGAADDRPTASGVFARYAIASSGRGFGAGPATGLLARRPDLIIEESGIFSAIEVAAAK